jgi:hypothetical protein
MTLGYKMNVASVERHFYISESSVRLSNEVTQPLGLVLNHACRRV